MPATDIVIFGVSGKHKRKRKGNNISSLDAATHPGNAAALQQAVTWGPHHGAEDPKSETERILGPQTTW